MKTQMKMLNLNKIARARRPLATVPRLALTLALSLAVPLGLALGAVAVAPATASAASGSCSPALNSPIKGWAWFASPQPGITFISDADTQFGFGDFPAGVSYPASWSADPINNPAPLLWLAQHVPSDANAFAQIFSSCQSYDPALIQTMNADHFAPSMVGGANPAGITTVSTTTTSPTQSTSPPTQTTKPKTSTTNPTPPVQPTSTSTTSKTNPAPQYPPVVTSPTATGGGSVASHVKQIQAILARDQQSVVADGPGKTPPQKGSPLPYIGGAVALLAGAVVVLGRRRNKRGMSADQANQVYGGRNDF